MLGNILPYESPAVVETAGDFLLFAFVDIAAMSDTQNENHNSIIFYFRN